MSECNTLPPEAGQVDACLPNLQVRRLAKVTIAVAVAAVSLFALSTAVLGSVHAALSFFAGRTLLHNERLTISAADRQNVTVRLKLPVRNLSWREVRLIGATSTCSCVTATKLPVRIAPWATAEIEILVRRHSSSQAIDEAVELFTDSDSVPRIAVAVSE